MSEIKAGSTDQSIYFVLLDATTGAPATGLTIANLDATYTRTRATAVKNDLTALGAANSAHSDNQAIEVDATNAPGLYRIDFPDAAFASGVAGVALSINGAAIKPAHKEFLLVVNTAEDIYTRLGAPAGASHAADIAAVKAETALIVADTNELQTDWANGGRLDVILDARASQASVDAILEDTGTTIPAQITALSIPSATENADALLNRDMSAVSDTNARSPLNALRFIRNKWDVAAGTLTVKKEDDATTAWTASVSTSAGAEPIIGNDPA